MHISIFSISALVAYPIHQAVQSIGSTAAYAVPIYWEQSKQGVMLLR